MDDASFEASLVVATGGGAALAVSLLAELVVEPPVDGVNGADATDGSAVELGFEGGELEADSVFNGVGLWVACGLATGAAEDGEATLDRLELVLATFLDDFVATLAGSAGALGALELLRLGVGAVAEEPSATLAGLLRVSVVVVDATSAGAEVVGAALPESVLLVCTAVGGVWISASLYLLLKNSAPPSTDAVMTPNAIPKWFTGIS